MDLEALLVAHPEADLAEVRRSVCEFATAAALPDLVTGFEQLVARSRPQR